MADLKTRFRGAERIAAPDLWPDIASREPRPPAPGPSRARRAVAATLALALAVAGVALVIRAFEGPMDGAQPITPAPLSMNGVIAYASIGEERVFWTVRPDGSDRTRVDVDVPGFVRVPSWSPDGTRIVFDVNSFDDPHPKGGNFDIYAANADGTDPIRLTSEKEDHSPIWSPDGTKIAYVHGWDDKAQIWVMNTDGSDPQQLTDQKGPNTFPSWSPDGAKIAFVSFDGSNADIYVMDADGSDVRRLTDGTAHEDQPAWSPDGRHIAYTSEGAGNPGIYVMSPDGTGVTQLLGDADPANLGFAWSPDGTKMAVVSIRGPGNDRNVYVLDVATGEFTSVGEPGAWYGPSWQPLPSPSATPTPSEPTPAPTLSTVALPDGLGASRLAIGEGAVWALASSGEADSSVLVRIDPATVEVLATTSLEADPWYVATGAGAVWVGSPRSSMIQRVDTATNEVAGQIQLPGDGVSAIAADDQAVWVEVIQDRSDLGQPNIASLLRIDPQTNQIVTTIPLEGMSGYDDEITIGAGAVWVAGVNLTGPSEERAANLLRIDPITNTISVALPVDAFSVSAGLDAVWVTSPADGVNDSLHKPEAWVAQEIDPRTNAVSEPIPLPGNVSGVLAVTADGVWFSGYDDEGLIHPVRFWEGRFDASIPPVDSIYTDMVFDDASDTIWLAAVSGLERIDAR
jgi:TolB protein